MLLILQSYFHLGRGCGAVLIQINIGTVSYTHLDVYKRQVTDEAAFLVNERDVIVSASDMGLAGKYFIPRPDLRQRVGKEKTFSLVSYLDGSAYVAYFPIADTDWYMISIIPALHIGDAGRALSLIHICSSSRTDGNLGSWMPALTAFCMISSATFRHTGDMVPMHPRKAPPLWICLLYTSRCV